jgi:serine/threonine protein kinase
MKYNWIVFVFVIAPSLTILENEWATCQEFIVNIPNYSCVDRNSIQENKTGKTFIVKNKDDVQFLFKVNENNRWAAVETQAYEDLKESSYVSKVIESTSTEKYIFYILQYGKKGLLSDYLKNDEYLSDPANILKFAEHMLQALRDFAAKKIVHCQLTLSTISINEDDQPLIFDFSSSTHENKKENYRGTPMFMAPEIFYEMKNGGLINYTQSVDIYALGIILYFTLYRRYPFDIIPSKFDELIQKEIILERDTPLIFSKIFVNVLTMKENRMPIEPILLLIRNKHSNLLERNLPEDLYFSLLSPTLSSNNQRDASNYYYYIGFLVLITVIVCLSLCLCCYQFLFLFVWKEEAHKNVSLGNSEVVGNTPFVDSTEISRVFAKAEQKNQEKKNRHVDLDDVAEKEFSINT